MKMTGVSVLAAVAAIGVMAGCAAPRSGTGAGTSTAPSASAAPYPAPTTGLLPAPAALTDRLVLKQTRLRAGQNVTGTLVVTDHGGRAVNLTHTCSPQFAVALANRRFPPRVAFALMCTTAPFLIRPGQNRFPFTAGSTAPACTRSEQKPGLPKCLPSGQPMPPLPAGRYWAVLVGVNLPLPPPAPVEVTLLPARANEPARSAATGRSSPPKR